LIVLAALLLIAKNVVRFLDLLELLLRLLVVRIQIRMVFARELAIGFFDVLVGGGPRHSESFIVITKLYGHGLRLYGEFKAFPGRDDIRMALSGVLEHLINGRVLVRGIVVIQRNSASARFIAHINGLFPAAMPPTSVL
jgi:hypothetical protein